MSQESSTAGLWTLTIDFLREMMNNLSSREFKICAKRSFPCQERSVWTNVISTKTENIKKFSAEMKDQKHIIMALKQISREVHQKLG